MRKSHCLGSRNQDSDKYIETRTPRMTPTVQLLVYLLVPLQRHSGPNPGGLGPTPHPNHQKLVYEYMRAH